MSKSLTSAGKNILHSSAPLVTEEELREQRKMEGLRNRAAGRAHLITNPWGRQMGKDTAMLDQQIAENAARAEQQRQDAAVRFKILWHDSDAVLFLFFSFFSFSFFFFILVCIPSLCCRCYGFNLHFCRICWIAQIQEEAQRQRDIKRMLDMDAERERHVIIA